MSDARFRSTYPVFIVQTDPMSDLPCGKQFNSGSQFQLSSHPEQR